MHNPIKHRKIKSFANIVYAFKLSKLFVGNFEPIYKTPFKALFLY